MQLTPEFRERFVKNLQGKDFILYGGLLELARDRGLCRISTQIVQIPNASNGDYAVVQAEIETDSGTYQEVGDASPASVNRVIAPHLLRMASTRAKARAMRDAVGIDLVALEELGETIVGDVPQDEALPEEVVLSFGKYASRSLQEVWEVDPKYVAWLRENARDPVVREMASKLMEGNNQVQ